MWLVPRTHCTDWFGGKFVMRLTRWWGFLFRVHDPKPNVRLIKIPVQCFAYMKFSISSEKKQYSYVFVIRAWKISNNSRHIHSIAFISPAQSHSTHKTCTWNSNSDGCVGATANVSSLHSSAYHRAEARLA